MPWVQREYCRYYQRSVRVDGQRKTIYCGTGEAAQQTYQEDLQRRSRRQAQRASQLRRQDHEHAVAAAVNNYSKLADLLVKASLLAHGFWQHDRGEWRLKRHGRPHSATQ